MKAIGYVRVSTEDQVREGVSLSAQREQVRSYCKARRWELVEVFGDEGISGKSMGRPGLLGALAALDEHRAEVLIVTKLDRLSRKVRDILGLVEDTFADNGATLVSIAENIDATTATGKAFLGILAVLAQMEREQIGERTRAALAHVKKQGRYLGRVPFGKMRDGEGRLVVDPEAQKELRRARAMRRRGASWREVAERMGWTVSRARTRLDRRYREQAWAGCREGQQTRRRGAGA